MSDIQEAILLGAKEIHNLREQNKELQKRLDFMIEQNDEKEDRINKAIEYIKKEEKANPDSNRKDVGLILMNYKRVLNILQGSDKE